MSQDEKLEEALKGTFPASDAFYLSPESAESAAEDEAHPHPTRGMAGDLLSP